MNEEFVYEHEETRCAVLSRQRRDTASRSESRWALAQRVGNWTTDIPGQGPDHNMDDVEMQAEVRASSTTVGRQTGNKGAREQGTHPGVETSRDKHCDQVRVVVLSGRCRFLPLILLLSLDSVFPRWTMIKSFSLSLQSILYKEGVAGGSTSWRKYDIGCRTG